MKAQLNDLIVGTLLGDGTILFPTKDSANARYTCSQGWPQADYAQHKWEVLQEFCNQRVQKTPNGGKGSFLARFHTRCHPVFTRYRHLFYPNGVKRVPENIAELLSPAAVAYWYMDDGSLTNGITPVLHTEGFSSFCLHRLQKAMKERYSVQVSIRPVREYSVLQVPIAERPRFMELVAPHIVPSMTYKLNLDKPTSVTCASCGKSFQPWHYWKQRQPKNLCCSHLCREAIRMIYLRTPEAKAKKAAYDLALRARKSQQFAKAGSKKSLTSA